MHVTYSGAISPVEIRAHGNVYRFVTGEATAVPEEVGLELLRQPGFRTLGGQSLRLEKSSPVGPLVIGITTFPRTHDYLTGVCAAIDAAAIDAKVILAPTCLDDIPLCGAQRHYLGDRLEIMPPLWEQTKASLEPGHQGLELNSDRLLRRLSLDHPLFLTLQDDLDFAHHGLERIAYVAKVATQIERLAWISFYTPYGQAGAHARALWPYDAGMFYGELAMLWRAEAAIEFLRGSDTSVAHDLMIQKHFAFRGPHWRCFGHSPCLVQHIGVESATGKAWLDGGRPRQTMNFYSGLDSFSQAKPF